MKWRKRGFKFYLLASKYSYNGGATLNNRLEETPTLNQKRFVNFESVVNLYKEVRKAL